MVGLSRRTRDEVGRTMNIRILGATVLMLVTGAAFAAPELCTGSKRDDLCLLSFGDLWASREAYDGRKIEVSGYLVSGFGRLVLYPGKDYFTFQQASGGIAIEVSSDVFKAARKKMKARDDAGDWEYESPCPVRVTGIYTAKPSGEYESLGVISSDALGMSMSVFKGACSRSELLSLSLDKE